MKSKIIGIVVCALLAIGVLALLICNWTGAFAETESVSTGNTYNLPPVTTLPWNHKEIQTVGLPNLSSLVMYDTFNAVAWEMPTLHATFRPAVNGAQVWFIIYKGDDPMNLNNSFLRMPLVWQKNSRLSSMLFTLSGVRYTYTGSPQAGLSTISCMMNLRYTANNVSSALAEEIREGNTNEYGIKLKSMKYTFQPSSEQFDGNINGDTNAIMDFEFNFVTLNNLNLEHKYVLRLEMNKTLPQSSNVNIWLNTNGQSDYRVYLPQTSETQAGSTVTNLPMYEPYFYTQLLTYYDYYQTGFNAGYAQKIDDTPQVEAVRGILSSVFTALDIKLFGVISVLDLVGLVVVLGLVGLIFKLARD